MYLYLLLFLIADVASFDMPETWINPADMRHSKKFEGVKHSDLPPSQSTSNTDNTPTCENFTCPAPVPSVCDSYLKRIINLLLIEVNLKNYKLPKGDVRIIPLTLYFTSGNLEILHKLASTENQDDISWSDFDHAFSSIFEEFDNVKESESEKTVVSPEHYYNVYFIFFGVVGCLIIVAIWLLLTGGSLFKVICSFSLLNFACALVWNLMRAYNMEKEKIREFHHNRFKENQSPTGLLEFFGPFRRLWGKSSESDDELPFLPESDPLVNVNYGKIFIETLGTIFEILPILGEKSGEMVAKFGESQNFLVRWIIIPFNFLFNPLLLILGFFLWTIIRQGFSIKFPFTSFSIGNRERYLQSQPETQSQLIKSVKAFEQKSAPASPQIQHSDWQYDTFPGPSCSTAPIKRIITEYHNNQEFTTDPEVKDEPRRIRDNPGRLPSITVTRKGPWQGSIVRYGFIRKRMMVTTVKNN